MPHPSSAPPGPLRRADARRSVERILEAAVEELALDPAASIGAIARRARVARATVYVHFPTREALIVAVTERAMRETADAIADAGTEEGDPREALTRVLSAAWRRLGRYHALVAINTRHDPAELHRLHEPVLSLLTPLLLRGQKRGEFNPDAPVQWLLTAMLDLIHAASRELTAGRLTPEQAEQVLVTTVLGALSPPSGRRD